VTVVGLDRPDDRSDGTPVALPLPEGRRRVLYAVRRRGETTADDVARQLDMTVSGARQHLSALVEDGLLHAREAPAPAGRRGRRTLVYGVTGAGDAQFPKAYGELTNELLSYLDEEHPGAIDRLFDKRRAARIANAERRLADRKSLQAKVAELTRILDEDGYLASWEPAGRDTFRILEHNCAIWAVAQRYGQSCSTELDFIRAVLPEGDVERVQHMVAGAPRCAYEVRRRRASGASGARAGPERVNLRRPDR
jgi:DeoR family transcriptional regulator, suf operon transcriptional repressor